MTETAAIAIYESAFNSIDAAQLQVLFVDTNRYSNVWNNKANEYPISVFVMPLAD